MKKTYFFLIMCFGLGLNAQIVSIPDSNFKAKLITLGYDTNANQEIEQSEALNVTSLNVAYSAISDLTGIEFFINLQILDCQSNYLTSLNVSALTSLQNLNCNNNAIQTLNVNGLTNLNTLKCSRAFFSTFDVTGLTSLQFLDCSYGQLTSLNLAGSSTLIKVECNNNHQLPSINLTGLTNLQDLRCQFNQFSSLNLSGLSNLQTLYCYENQISSLNFNELTSLVTLNCSQNSLTTIQVNGLANLEILICEDNQLSALNVVSMPKLRILNFSNNQISAINVSGITTLQTLTCSFNQLTSLNISGLPNIYSLICDNNQISNLSLTGAPLLGLLNCNFNNLTNLNLTGLTQLRQLSCTNNQLSSLDLTGLHLSLLNCQYNTIQSLDLSGQINNFFSLHCANNQIQSLNVSNLSNLQFLNCSNNLLTNLDVNPSVKLDNLICSNNQLISLFAKNGKNEGNFVFSNNPSLQYICADESQFVDIQNKITSYEYTNCHVNSYCSFVPGGTYYSIQGNNKYDQNNNGCNFLDSNFPNLKLSFSNGTNTGNLIPNSTGNYRYDVQIGAHTITPLFENPTYFIASPSTTTVSFPSSASPSIKNFCITPNGTHNDLEVILIPLNDAISGFDSNYKIVYYNKGTHTQSGTINLLFEDSVLDFNYSNPNVNNQSLNNLEWSFTNLAPFETRTILGTFNLNSPTETPALNSGDVLHYTVSISASIDETPLDNIFTLNQTVYNSFDPNDKTCLEGATITPEKVGDYVHYLIRFENTGTANAQNIVVKDMIDTTKFDVSTLIPINGSHTFETRITNTNQVEFIFENIQLPFDDANNDGYVVFKIKTKSTLTTGSSFSNTASIYFDYNFPIITNTSTTTIQALTNQDFEFSNYFEIAPNPAKKVLNIQSKNDIKLSSISIYNTIGQLVLVIPNAKEVSTIDVTHLTSGTYFVKVNSEKGSSNTKFIKE